MGLLNASSIGPGTLGLCLTNLLLLESLIEPNLEAATGAQFEFIALARIHEPQSESEATLGVGFVFGECGQAQVRNT